MGRGWGLGSAPPESRGRHMTDRVREVETPTGPQLQVYANRRGALFWACYTLIIEVGVILVIIWISHTTEPIQKVIIGAISCAFMAPILGWATLYYSYWAVACQPLLTVSDDGIVDTGSSVGFGLIRWDEIQGIVVYKSSKGGTVYLCVLPENKDILIARLPFWRKLMYRILWWSIRGPSPVLIPQALLSVPARELVERIRGLDKGWPPLTHTNANRAVPPTTVQS